MLQPPMPTLLCRLCGCSQGRRARSRRLVADRRRSHSGRCDPVLIEGGEPLAKPGFLRLLSRCAHDAMTLLRTNGTLIDQSMAAALKAEGVGRVLVDMMGADAESHEWFTRAPGSFAATCDGIRHSVAAGVPTDVLVILTRQTAPQLNALLNLAADLGAQRVGVLRLYPLGRAKQIWSDIALSLPEQTAAIRALVPPDGLSVMQSWHRSTTRTAAGRQQPSMPLDMLSAGRPHASTWISAKLVKSDIRTSGTTTRSIAILRSGSVEKGCAECSASQGTAGGCRSTAYAAIVTGAGPRPIHSTRL